SPSPLPCASTSSGATMRPPSTRWPRSWVRSRPTAHRRESGSHFSTACASACAMVVAHRRTGRWCKAWSPASKPVSPSPGKVRGVTCATAGARRPDARYDREWRPKLNDVEDFVIRRPGHTAVWVALLGIAGSIGLGGVSYVIGRDLETARADVQRLTAEKKRA